MSQAPCWSSCTASLVWRSRASPERRVTSARSASSRRCTRSLLRRPAAHCVAGHRVWSTASAGFRRARQPASRHRGGTHGVPQPTVRAPDRALQRPGRIMTALVSFDRVFEVLDLEPMIAERRTPLRCGAVRPAWSSSMSISPTREPRRSPWLRSSRSRPGKRAAEPGALRRVVPGRTRPACRPGRALRCRQDDYQPSVPGSTMRGQERCASTASTCATPRWRRYTMPSAWSPKTPISFTTPWAPTCVTAHPTPPTKNSSKRCEPPRFSPWSSRCPTVSTPS